MVCSFGSFRLEADGTLWRGEAVVHLPPKELAALRLLLESAGQIVSPLQLKRALWGDVHVTTDSVPKCLSSLRARLEPESCIQTVYKRGYRFTAEVVRQSGPPAGVLPRLAILPFANEYSVPEHLGHAIAEETMARLSNARFPSLSVLARDSVFTLVHRGFTAQQIGQTLKADLVLTGTLRAFSSQFRLRAEMIRVEDGVQIWVEDLLVDKDRLTGLESELVERLTFRLATGVPGDRPSSPGWSTGVPGDRSSSPGWSTGARNPISALLRRGPLAFYGRISYGLYMTHIMVFVYFGWFDARMNSRGFTGILAVVALRLVATTVVASALWYGFESRILKLKRYF